MNQPWGRFNPGSGDYYGSGAGQTIPPWMQGAFGRVAAGSGIPSGYPNSGSYGGSGAPTAGGHLTGQGGLFSKWQDQQRDAEAPEWFQDFQTRWMRMQQGAAPQAPAPAAMPPAPAMPAGDQPPAAVAPFAAPTAAGDAPSTAPSPVAPQPNLPAPEAPVAPTAPPVQNAAPPAYNPQPYQAGLGSAVVNGWYHDSDPTGGNYSGDFNGQPIYWHYGNQSAKDQYNSQYLGNPVSSVSPAPVTPQVPSGNPTLPGTTNVNPNANPAPVYNSGLPEALGGTESGSDWAADNAAYVARSISGFGDNIPEALGGTMKMARGGAVNRGLGSAVEQIRSYGRGPDTMLAHISPDESQVIDYLQGGQRTNPVTGLPEYSMFGDILKAVARAGAAIGGFMYGGPMGAAAASAAATKLTGGSWKDALTSGAMSGIGGWAANGIGGAGWNPMSQSAAQAAKQGLSQSVSSSLAAEGLKSSGLGAEFLKTAMSAPGMAAGLGALAGQSPASPAPMALPPPAPGPRMDALPQQRTYNPYQGDPLHFAEPVGGGMAPGMNHTFYTPLLPVPKYPEPIQPVQGEGQPLEGLGYANGGRIRRFAIGGPALPLAGADMPGQPGGALQAPNLRAAALAGYNMFARGGAPHEGPVRGPGTGTSDSIPARLSDGEHVWTSAETSSLGGGNNELGQKVQYKLRKIAKQNPAKLRAMVRGLGAA